MVPIYLSIYLSVCLSICLSVSARALTSKQAESWGQHSDRFYLGRIMCKKPEHTSPGAGYTLSKFTVIPVLMLSCSWKVLRGFTFFFSFLFFLNPVFKLLKLIQFATHWFRTSANLLLILVFLLSLSSSRWVWSTIEGRRVEDELYFVVQSLAIEPL